MAKKLVIQEGQLFNRLTIIKEVQRRNRQRHFLCKCICGKKKTIQLGALTSGSVVSCGCSKYEKVSKLNLKHGNSHLPEYRIWTEIKQRCYNSKRREYLNYGGRGIKVCDSWLADVNSFLKDMGSRPSSKHSIDRIDVNGDYCKENCRWADDKQQANNRRNTIYIEYQGTKTPLTEFAKIHNLNRGSFYERIFKYKWSVEKALKLKPHENKKHK